MSGCIQVDGVKLLDRFNNRKSATGTLYLTATHLIFVDPEGKRETWVSKVLSHSALQSIVALHTALYVTKTLINTCARHNPVLEQAKTIYW